MEEMEAKELMKYDWVMNDRIGVCQVIGLPREVKDYPIEITVMYYPVEGFTEIRNIGEHYIQPIPITPEILEKNGLWEKDPDRNPNCLIAEANTTNFNDAEGKPHSWVQIQDISSIECSRWYLKIWRKGKLGISGYVGYVHELQHALRLAGINKEIVL